MPDIIFMLLIFFMVTTVLREFSGLPVSLPRAERIEKLESKRHTSDIWVSKDGLFSIEENIGRRENILLSKRHFHSKRTLKEINSYKKYRVLKKYRNNYLTFITE